MTDARERVHGAARAGYDRQADVYADVRPAYHPAMVARIVEGFCPGFVVDLGAGTGIFTNQLVSAGVEPIAVEPVEAMRAAVAQAHPDLVVVDGTAEATGLGSNSVSTVVVAQAFHWFDHAAALIEIRRILESGGHLICAWNVRDETVPWVAQWTAIVDQHAGDTPRYRTMEWRRSIDSDADFEIVDEWSVPNAIPATPDTVVARALSTSFIAALEPDAQAAVLDEIRQLAESVGPTFDFPYRSEFQAWRLV